MYVSTFHASAARNACKPIAVRWMEPLNDPAYGVSLYPNARGHEQVARLLEAAMRKAGI